MTPEGQVKAAIKRWLAQIGAWYFMPVSNGMGKMGVPDFICCWRGVFFAVEAKAPGRAASTTPLQREQMRQIALTGGLCWVVDDPEQLTRVQEELHAQVNPR